MLLASHAASVHDLQRSTPQSTAAILNAEQLCRLTQQAFPVAQHMEEHQEEPEVTSCHQLKLCRAAQLPMMHLFSLHQNLQSFTVLTRQLISAVLTTCIQCGFTFVV